MTARPGAPVTAYIGIGSNLDSPRERCDRAVADLGNIPETHLERVSSYYLSAPFGPVEQPDFVNAVAQVTTRLDAKGLFRELQSIERAQGRKRGVRWGPRVIDLDLLVHGQTQIDDADLTVPHPGIVERNFVLLPLRELAPDLEIPGTGRIADIVVSEAKPRITRLD